MGGMVIQREDMIISTII